MPRYEPRRSDKQNKRDKHRRDQPALQMQSDDVFGSWTEDKSVMGMNVLSYEVASSFGCLMFAL